MRLLAGILAGQAFTAKLTGDASLQKRPMKRVIAPLREMGADIRARDDNFAPLEIRGGTLKSINYAMPMASAQVKSAVLLAGLFADGVTSSPNLHAPATIPSSLWKNLAPPSISKATPSAFIRWHTRTAAYISRRAPSTCPAIFLRRSFFMAAASLFPDSNLVIHNVGLNPTRTAILDVFSSMGASIQMLSLRGAHGEIVGDLAVKGAR